MKKFIGSVVEKVVSRITVWRMKRQLRAEIKSLQDLLEYLESTEAQSNLR